MDRDEPRTSRQHCRKVTHALEDLIWSGRRNISPAQRAYLIGKLYRETKKEAPNPTGKNQYTEVGANNLPQPNTAEKIAEQFNVSPAKCALTGCQKRPFSCTHDGWA